MLNDQRVLAVIPARKGSKRLPNKNMLPFHGKPLIYRTINAAMKSALIDQVVVSSDSEEVLSFASNLGVAVHQRPNVLAQDSSGSVDVALDVLNVIHGFDVLVWLQPTSPLRGSYDIDVALTLYKANNAESVVSVCKAAHSPLWSCTILENSQLSFLSPKSLNTRSQDLSTFYQLNGAIYIVSIDKFIESGTFLTKESYAFVMPEEKSVDIDTIIDFKLAELLFEVSGKNHETPRDQWPKGL